MNRLRNIVGLIAVCATAAFFTGCGEDDSPGDSGPVQNAPASLNGRTYQLTDTAGNSSIVFDPAAMNYTLTPSDNSGTESGTFTATPSGDGYNVSLVNAAGDTNSTLVLTFTAPGTGTYTFDRPGQPQAAGNFVQTSADPNPTTGEPAPTTGEPAPTTGEPAPTTGNPTPGNAPATLTTLTFTTGPGVVDQGTVITTTFNGNQFSAVRNDGQSMGSGTFTYAPNGNNAHLVMSYSGSTDADDFTLTFNGGGAGTYTGTQTSGTTTVPASGTFTY